MYSHPLLINNHLHKEKGVEKLKTLVVNFFAGPGAGKSSTASGVFSELKWQGVNCELVTEYAKDLTWEERFKTMKNQFLIFGKQLQRIDRLIGKVDVIITDSPILLSLVYKPSDLSDNYDKTLLEVFGKFNNLNYFLQRQKKYMAIGRTQTEGEAKEVDNIVKETLLKYNIEHENIIACQENIKYITNNILRKINYV